MVTVFRSFPATAFACGSTSSATINGCTWFLDHDGYAREQPIIVADDLSRIEFTLENRTGNAHRTGLHVSGLPAGDYSIAIDDRTVTTTRGSSEGATISLPVGAGSTARVAIVRASR
jgi:hypothetical protein